MTLDELSGDFPSWHSRVHVLSEADARHLASLISAGYDERLRLEIGVAVQFTAQRLIDRPPPREELFRSLDREVDLRSLSPELDRVANSDEPHHVAAVALSSTLDWMFGSAWRDRMTTKIARTVRSLVVDVMAKRRGRHEDEALQDFFGALVDLARKSGCNCALPSNDDPSRETAVMRFARECANATISTGVAVLEARRASSGAPRPFVLPDDEISRRQDAIRQSLGLSQRALSDRIRKCLRED